MMMMMVMFAWRQWPQEEMQRERGSSFKRSFLALTRSSPNGIDTDDFVWIVVAVALVVTAAVTAAVNVGKDSKCFEYVIRLLDDSRILQQSL